MHAYAHMYVSIYVSHNQSYKVYIMPLVIYALEGGHTHTNTYTHANKWVFEKVISINQVKICYTLYIVAMSFK